jgi:hypothetical protein
MFSLLQTNFFVMFAIFERVGGGGRDKKISLLVAEESHFFLFRKKTGEVGSRSVDDDTSF